MCLWHLKEIIGRLRAGADASGRTGEVVGCSRQNFNNAMWNKSQESILSPGIKSVRKLEPSLQKGLCSPHQGLCCWDIFRLIYSCPDLTKGQKHVTPCNSWPAFRKGHVMGSPVGFWLQDSQPKRKRMCVWVCVCSVEEKMWNHLEWSTHLILPVLWVCDAKIEELACKSSSPLAVITFQLVAFYFSGCWWMVSAGELGCLKGALAAMGRRGMCVFMFLPCAGCWNDAVTHWPGELVLILVIPPFCKHWCKGQSSWRQVGWSTSYQEQSEGVSNTWFAAVFLVTVPFSSPTTISKSKGSKDPFLIYVTYNQHCVRHLTVPFTAVWETLFLVL